MRKISAMEWYKSLIETRTSLGLSKKVASTYKGKTADDVVKETFLTKDGFIDELKKYSLTKCKMSPKNIEVNEYPDRKEIYFYSGTGGLDLIVLFPFETDLYFGVLNNNREEGEILPLKIRDLSGSIETSGLKHWLPVDTIYEISSMNLEVMKKYIKRHMLIYGQRR